MNFSRHLLVGMAVLGLHLGLASAEEPPVVLFSAPPAPTTEPTVAPQMLNIGADCGAIEDGDCGRCGFIGGAGLYVIQPYFENNPGYNFIVQGAKPEVQKVDRVNITHHLDVAPLVWLGYIDDDGFGGRVRYWHFRQGVEQALRLPPFVGTYDIKFVPKPPPGHYEPVVTSGTLYTLSSAAPLGLQAFGDTLSLMHGPEATTFVIDSNLNVQVLDLECIRDFRAAGWNFLVAGGLRLGWIDQTYNVYDAQSTSPRELRTLSSSYQFQGVGPVVALEARLPLGQSSFCFYGSTRASVLFGSADQQAAFGGQELRNDDPNPQFASDHRTRSLWIAELELGLEYRQTVGRTLLFGQLGLVAQDWFNAGNASHSTNFTYINSPPTIGGATADSDIAFFGFACRLGVGY